MTVRKGAPLGRTRVALAAVAALSLAGCSSLPRGAAFESEVLAASTGSSAGTATIADFAVEPVTRDQLSRFAQWPVVGEETYPWPRASESTGNRTISPGDRITVVIWNTEENSLLASPGQRQIRMEGITVSSNGSVFIPYAGSIRVSGMSPDHAREVIEAELTQVTPAAQVQLELEEGRSNAISLVGGVGNPGAYTLPDQSYTVLALLAEGGGVSPGILNPQIRLMRDGELYGTSVDRLFEEPGLDATLRPGDRVIVEEDERVFMSLGAAGSEAVHPFPDDNVSAIEAMSIIGGVSESRGDPRGILILRRYPESVLRADGTGPSHTRVVFTIDLTTADGLFSADQFRIQSGDLVYATENPVASAQTIIGILGSSLNLLRQSQDL